MNYATDLPEFFHLLLFFFVQTFLRLRRFLDAWSAFYTVAAKADAMRALPCYVHFSLLERMYWWLRLTDKQREEELVDDMSIRRVDVEGGPSVAQLLDEQWSFRMVAVLWGQLEDNLARKAPLFPKVKHFYEEK